ncbi:Pc22g12310 [Penicillium rubens Wisconsin 54-1255]|uniref:Pc22g12310 protein n=1 Tax=Penicillium rubens (strain ATCC 28089 / DSM 1075 / NRRL 1951 / Wisconsin 54-1255) TaxID=500485 RepID=B6HRH3_PENRW|nr:Pc22g12310 [Penicillium rubens Wisconsin 54-1255]
MKLQLGVSVFVRNNIGTFILGKRRGSIGAGSLPIFYFQIQDFSSVFTIKETWGLPGGHFEFGEAFEACAAREVVEETGLVVHHLRFLAVANSGMHKEGKHYAVVFPESCTSRDKGPDKPGFEGRRLSSPLLELFQQ